jgi:hypothetical protein
MKRFAAVLGLMLITTVAHAQKVGPNGGMLAGKSGHQIELVVGATELTVYIVTDGKVHSTNGSQLRAIVQMAGKNETVNLMDSGGEKFIGRLSAPLAKGSIVVVTGKDDHGDTISARYTIN